MVLMQIKSKHDGLPSGSVSGRRQHRIPDGGVLLSLRRNALSEHPVPVSESALRAIRPRSMVIDIYIWLAYRLHALKRDVDVG